MVAGWGGGWGGNGGLLDPKGPERGLRSPCALRMYELVVKNGRVFGCEFKMPD